MQRSFSFGLLVLAVVIVQCYAQSVYILGSQGANCFDTCFEQNMNCNPRIVTNDTDAIFSLVGVNCLSYNKTWSGHNQPGFISDPNSPDFGQCIGFLQMPGGVLCAGSSPDSSRICRCDPPSKNVKTFGFGLSSGAITTHENVVFRHIVAPGDVGVMTHFWTTYDASEDNGVIFRYYIDNETNPSIEFTPSLACGVGFHDQSAPWGINLFGKGAADAGWYHNIRIPFQNNVRITMQHLYQNYTNFYTILRGGTNVPINIAGLPIPSSARLQMFSFSQVLQPIEYINLAFVPRGYSGMYYLHSMSIESESLNFIEGCYRMYTADQEFPGTILGTGFEDYYNSAWAFNAGKFAFPGSGLTYYNDTNVYRLSAYRVHDSEPIQFSDGFQLTWRNGDVLDVTGVKCMVEGSNGVVVGTPTASMIQAYTWVYTWKNEELD